MLAGVIGYFVFANFTFLEPTKPFMNGLISFLTPSLIFAQLRLIDAEWQIPEGDGERYVAELVLYARDRIGLLADISRVLAEDEITITSLNSRTNKQGIATFNVSFETAGVEEIQRVMARLRQIAGVVDIQRAIG